METATESPMLVTRWMSPGGANPLTVPTGLALRPTTSRWSLRSAQTSSYSVPCRTAVQHQVRWSWIGACWPGSQTMTTIENQPSDWAGARCVGWPLGAPASSGAGSGPGPGPRPSNPLTTRSAVSCHEPPDRTARRIAAVSGPGHVPATLGSSATERDIAPPGSLSTTVTTGLTSAQIPLSYRSIAPVYESASGFPG